MEETKVDVKMPEISNPQVDDATYGGFVLCPRCSFDTRTRIAPVSDEDKQEFIRCLLGEKQFTKDFTLFGGQFKIRMTDLSVEESEKVMSLCHDLLQDPMFLIKGTQIKLMFSVIQIQNGTQKIDVDRKRLMELKSAEEALTMRKEYFGKMSETLISSLISIHNTFSNMLINIANGSLDRNF